MQGGGGRTQGGRCHGLQALVGSVPAQLRPEPSRWGRSVVVMAVPRLTSLVFTAALQATPSAFQPGIAHVSPRSPRVSVDVWATLADFCNILTTVNQSEVPLYKDPDDDLALLSLEEDRLLSGFVPLLVAPQEPCYVERTSDKVSTRPNIPPSIPPQTFILGKFSVQTEHD